MVVQPFHAHSFPSTLILDACPFDSLFRTLRGFYDGSKSAYYEEVQKERFAKTYISWSPEAPLVMEM
ncbi:MAG: hypothetical protein A2341_13975 [Deltaproteobacteria bacterium RIFOXYB12_FULL_58_9]|nr:MAG: hypothetical protein A2341_13975 [Deltaproteobacteria bacterium RIFOXYB12_FULL_58_9]